MLRAKKPQTKASKVPTTQSSQKKSSTKQIKRKIATKTKTKSLAKSIIKPKASSSSSLLSKKQLQLPSSIVSVQKRKFQDRPSSVKFPNGIYSVEYNDEPTIEQTPLFHSNVNPERPQEYWDYTTFVPAYGNEDNYEILEKIIDGKNSVVMSGFAVNSNVQLCIKTMMPISPTKIKRQALALTNLKNLPHVQNLLDICHDKESRTTSFVSMFSPHEQFESFQNNLTADEITMMAFQMFDGLDNIHSKGIIHRNIHPGNVLMNPKGPKKELCIVDFDNCEFFHPATAYATKRITRRGYLSPEMSLNMPDYHYAHDVWGAGLIVAQMVFPTEQIFKIQEGQSDIDFIAQIVGSEAIAKFIEKYNLHEQIDPDTVVPALQAKYPGVTFKNLKSKNATPGLVDLIERTVLADFDARILPFEATCLDIFAPLHDDYADLPKNHHYDPKSTIPFGKWDENAWQQKQSQTKQ